MYRSIIALASALSIALANLSVADAQSGATSWGPWGSLPAGLQFQARCFTDDSSPATGDPYVDVRFQNVSSQTLWFQYNIANLTGDDGVANAYTVGSKNWVSIPPGLNDEYHGGGFVAMKCPGGSVAVNAIVRTTDPLASTGSTPPGNQSSANVAPASTSGKHSSPGNRISGTANALPSAPLVASVSPGLSPILNPNSPSGQATAQSLGSLLLGLIPAGNPPQVTDLAAEREVLTSFYPKSQTSLQNFMTAPDPCSNVDAYVSDLNQQIAVSKQWTASHDRDLYEAQRGEDQSAILLTEKGVALAACPNPDLSVRSQNPNSRGTIFSLDPDSLIGSFVLALNIAGATTPIGPPARSIQAWATLTAFGVLKAIAMASTSSESTKRAASIWMTYACLPSGYSPVNWDRDALTNDCSTIPAFAGLLPGNGGP